MNRHTSSAWVRDVFSEEQEQAFRSRICAELAWEASRVEQAVALYKLAATMWLVSCCHTTDLVFMWMFYQIHKPRSPLTEC